MANIASATAMYIQAVVATGLVAEAKGSPTVFTCKSDDQLDSQEGAPWIIPASHLITVVALMVLSAIFGRWSALRSAGTEAVRDPEHWVVVSEDITSPDSEQGKEKGISARERPIEAEGEGSRAPSESPKGGDKRTQAPRGLGSVREVASQAPCTYTILRGNARGRFQVLPDAAHG
jgi:hypothetical protein